MSTRQIIKAVDEELKQSIEIVYVPFELDAHDEWMSDTTIRKACENFNTNLSSGNLVPNMFHGRGEDNIFAKTENFTIMKSWINEVECTVGEEVVPEGTWITKLQWENTESWELRKSGVFQGVSIGCMGLPIKPEDR